jgi:hypothetical protein
MSERQHIYEDLNKSSSARPGGSQQLEVLPCPNSKRSQTIPPIFWLDAGSLAWRGDFNARQSPIVRLYFYLAPIFCIPTNILYTCLNFQETLEF